MQLSWLIEEFYKHCYGKEQPTKIRMGIKAYSEYLEVLQGYPDEYFARVTFQSARVMVDPKIDKNAVEFSFESRLTDAE